ncbi:hypothetical protein GCM10010193_46270 [Kitasatospora atroaurantiaca]|uniref:Secreted protein n=1 Tax=Kitasatospora atroaurantiaca TaxID=285545 RepID=A0A561EZF1_9ACTN|nr:DUF6167 family protein [Kitasatospora atroaurantiaca]TWE20991.1 hypothetical protein FB465_6158 [Kitasatospora atroaurantiaca]
MVRRIFWMAVGAGATVWAMNKANEAVHRLTPDSLSGTAARGALHLGDAAKRFAADVRAGMAEREEQLRTDLGLDGTAVVEPPRRRALRREPEHRAISAAPGSPAAALPSPRRTARTAQAIQPMPRPLDELPGSTPNRKDH